MVFSTRKLIVPYLESASPVWIKFLCFFFIRKQISRKFTTHFVDKTNLPNVNIAIINNAEK